MKMLAAVLLVLLAGCTSAPDPKDAPILERPEWFEAPDDFLVAAWGIIWVPRGQTFWITGPLQPIDEALLDHERHHVGRQYELGLVAYHALYSTSARFRWQEEREAYERHAATLIRNKILGREAVENYLATIVLHDFYRRMVTPEEARSWAADVARRN